MANRIQATTVKFDPTKGREQSEPGFVNFDQRVRIAECAMKGFNVRYDDGDHHILQETIQVTRVAIDGTQVSFTVNFLLRDSSGNIDDPFDGQVDVLVIADVG